jgi:SOS response regulatory protein OraA/RecX
MGFDLLNLSYIAAYKSAENGMIDDATFETQAERILGRALVRGAVTYSELNEALPSDKYSSEQIETVLARLMEHGIRVTERV